MNIREMPGIQVDKLIPYARNSRTHSKAQIAQIAASIREFGFTNPVLIDENDGIIAGHGRVRAALKLGLPDVPYIRLSHLTEAQKRAYVIADNQLALNAGWDEEMLRVELEELRDLDFDLDTIGFDAEALAEALGESLRDLDTDKYTAKIQTPVYEMKGERPKVEDLYSTDKTGELSSKIMKADLPDDVRGFLMSAATRHTVFNYENIAEFYAHADAETQALMEESALVIIDYNQAVENGYVKLTETLMSLSAESDESI